MAPLKDHISDLPVRMRLLANRTRVRASNWRNRQARRMHVDRPRDRYQTWLRRRAARRGRDPLPERIGRRVPVYQNRTHPGTGRPRWTERSPEDLGRWQAAREQGRRLRRRPRPGRATRTGGATRTGRGQRARAGR
jgi:hypothetical protein